MEALNPAPNGKYSYILFRDYAEDIPAPDSPHSLIYPDFFEPPPVENLQDERSLPSYDSLRRNKGTRILNAVKNINWTLSKRRKWPSQPLSFMPNFENLADITIVSAHLLNYSVVVYLTLTNR